MAASYLQHANEEKRVGPNAGLRKHEAALDRQGAGRDGLAVPRVVDDRAHQLRARKEGEKSRRVGSKHERTRVTVKCVCV